MDNKQLILDLGWNPEVHPTLENVLRASEETKKRLFSVEDAKGIPLVEAIIFSRKDLVLNLDDFESGECNVCLITGLSGSGKSTLSYTVAEQYGAEIIHLDWFQNYHSVITSKDPIAEEIKSYLSFKMIEEYMKANPKVKADSIKFSDIRLDAFAEYFVPFFGWLMNKMKKNKNKRYVVEGIHIMLYIPYKDVKGYPLYCVETSAIKSLVRHWKRDDWTIQDIIDNGYGDIIQFKQWNDQYNRFKDSMEEGYLEKAEETVTYYNSEYKEEGGDNMVYYTNENNEVIEFRSADEMKEYLNGNGICSFQLLTEEAILYDKRLNFSLHTTPDENRNVGENSGYFK